MKNRENNQQKFFHLRVIIIDILVNFTLAFVTQINMYF